MHKRAENLNALDNIIYQEYNIFENIENKKAGNPKLFELGYYELDRYSDIKPFKNNTIKISTSSGYINASPINIGKKQNLFISTQGPTAKTIEDFWTMVFDYDCKVIVMLCKVIEGGRKKCEEYWKAKMKKFEIIIQNEQNHGSYVVREIKLINLLNKEERVVNQIHFIGWPDHGIPEYKDGKVFQAFSEMNKFVDKFNDGEKPIIVHCSAGVGRTGTFVSMYLLEKEIEKQINDKSPIIRINIFNLVRKIKEMRIYMVQTNIQYKFVYLFVEYLLNTRNV